MNPIENADNFLATGNTFRLGHLVTEQSHPLTQNLSDKVQLDILDAIESLKTVDVLAIEKFGSYLPDIEMLNKDIKTILSQGARVFLCGCGATGRLSLTLESLWRSLNPQSEQVQAFMAGGDIALVHAVEGFEDFPEHGARQLMQMGFTSNDLLIAITEGGETPFVIGAAEKASEVSVIKPYFIYCNPTDTLRNTVERSRRVIENRKIHHLCWDVGPMAIAGSTRMQASTVLQWGVGMALFFGFEELRAKYEEFLKVISSLDLSWLSAFILKESQIYTRNEFVHYFADEYAITTFTDTTERAPTFSLIPFQHLKKETPQSLAYVSIISTATAQESWMSLIKRVPVCLGWESKDILSRDYLLKYDFSEIAFEMRKEIIDTPIHPFRIEGFTDGISFYFCELEYKLSFSQSDKIFRHTILKTILNIHSTLVMGKINRYKSNLMTWVKPSNGKLIDRACRYVQYLLKFEGIDRDYETIVRELFRLKESLPPTDSIVLATYQSLKEKTLN